MSFHLSRVSIDSCRGDIPFEPVQLGFEVFDLLLKIFELLPASVSDVCDDHRLDRYLVMLNERAHSIEGRLEGREPIGGLFRNFEEDLCAIGYSLSL